MKWPHTMEQNSQQAQALALIALHSGPEPLVVPCAWDAGSARLLCILGFKAIGISSAGIAFASGVRDGRNLVSRAQIMENARAVVAESSVPVAADLESGFGSSLRDVEETIRQAIAAGVAGGSIEDTTGDPENPIYSLAEAAERVAAAAAVAQGSGGRLMLTARTENYLHGRNDLDETARRLQAFEIAGADMVYVGGVPDLESVRILCGCVSIPVAILVGRGGSFTVSQLTEAGVNQINLGAALPRAAFGSLWRAAKELRESGSLAFLEQVVQFDEIDGRMKSAISD